MWLDRFSGQSTPAGAHTPSRTYSPGPRKSSHLAPLRAGLGLNTNRSNTSLDLSPNASTISLPSPTRPANGSALRHEQKPPPDLSDPLKVLRSILGISEDSAGWPSKENASEDLTQKAKEVNFHGLSLQGLLKDTSEEDGLDLHGNDQSENSKDDRHKYENLHSSISEFDGVLKSVETYLNTFKAELGQVSAEIESLQARSVQLNAMLDNRRKVEKILGPSVEEIGLAPATVRAIADGPIDETFIRALNEVDARSTVIDAKTSSSEHLKALEDVKPLLDNLKTKAIERVRDFLVSQIKALRSPNINAQIIQQQSFLRYKDLSSFLSRNHPILADEVGQAYVNTMKWYYNSHFIRYVQSLDKIPLHILDQHDLLGADPGQAKRNVTNSQKVATQQHDAFSIGKRAEILKSGNDIALPAHLAEDGKVAQYLETPFHNFNLALIDNVSAEYALTTEFFSAMSYQQVSRKVIEIFEPTFTLGHNLTKQLIENSTDCLGVLLCLRLSQRSAFELQKRKVPIADSYINYTNILLWPRFQMVMDMHCDSLKRVPTGVNRGTTAAFSLVGGNDAAKASVAPHAITQRFGQFLRGILILSTDAGDDEPVSNSLGRLRSEYESLMGKLAKGAGDASKRNRFLYNNYSLVSTIISDTQGKLAEEHQEHFGTLVKNLKSK